MFDNRIEHINFEDAEIGINDRYEYKLSQIKFWDLLFDWAISLQWIELYIIKISIMLKGSLQGFRIKTYNFM